MSTSPENQLGYEDEAYLLRHQILAKAGEFSTYSTARDLGDRVEAYTGDQMSAYNVPEIMDITSQRLWLKPLPHTPLVHGIREIFLYTLVDKELFWEQEMGVPKYMFAKIVSASPNAFYFGISVDQFYEYDNGEKRELVPHFDDLSQKLSFNFGNNFDLDASDTFESDPGYNFRKLQAIAEAVDIYKLYAQPPQNGTEPQLG